MLTLLFSGAVFAALYWTALHRFPALLAAFFILFSLTTRTLSLAYLDLAGPVYSDQLDRMVGGANSMPLFACSILIFIATLIYVFRPSFWKAHIPLSTTRCKMDKPDVGSFTFLFCCIFIVILYLDMLIRGSVPLFSGIDRLEYNQNTAGLFHQLLLEHGFLLAGFFGLMMVRPRFRGGDFNFQFFFLYLLVIIYFALTGNRFSAFYSFTSFFVIPLAAVAVFSNCGYLPAVNNRKAWKRFLCSRWVVWFALTLALVGLTGLVLNSVINVRAYDDPFELLMQRILVQPVELWYATWIHLNGDEHTTYLSSWNFLFSDPIDSTRNTSIQMLMVKNLGWDRAIQLLQMGQQYAGGYPEILFELFGTWLTLLVIPLFCIPTVMLLRLIVLATCRGWILTILMALYVYYGFSLLFIGGMLNFLTTWTFWVKIVALVSVYLFERSRDSAVQFQPKRLSFPKLHG
jgi:hypothetical protein